MRSAGVPRATSVSSTYSEGTRMPSDSRSSASWRATIQSGVVTIVSAKSGVGLDALRETIESLLPRPAVELEVVVPYDRGELVARLHERGEVLETEHNADGTRLRVRVGRSLAAELEPFVTTPA